MKTIFKTGMIALVMALSACGAKPEGSQENSLLARIEAADEFIEGPSEALCEALEDQHITQKDLKVYFAGGDLFIPFDGRPFYMVENERYVEVPDGEQILLQPSPRVVFCTFDIQNGLVRSIQMGGI